MIDAQALATPLRLAPTRETYAELQQAYEHFNQRLFGDTLPQCLITLQREKRTCGYFSADYAITGGPFLAACDALLTASFQRAVQGRTDSPPGTLEDQGIRGIGHPAVGVLVQPRPSAHADWGHSSGKS